MRAIAILVTILTGLGSAHGASSATEQANGARRQSAQQITVLTVEGMT
jgi:hypothetical protein